MRIADVVNSIGNIKIKSNIPLVWKSVTQEQAIIYTAIIDFSLNSVAGLCPIVVCDFIQKITVLEEEKAVVTKNEGEEPVTIIIPKVEKVEFECIDVRYKSFNKEQVSGLFTMMQTAILPEDAFYDKMEQILQMALLTDTKYVPTKSGKLLYGAKAEDFELC